jgi:hypothetical protein
MSNLFDIEILTQGAEEIDRKRRVITRICGIITNLVLSFMSEQKTWKLWSSEITTKFGMISIAKKAFGGQMSLGGYPVYWSGNDCGIPAREIPALYKMLPEIINRVDEEMPKAGIKEHFEFLVQQAPAR